MECGNLDTMTNLLLILNKGSLQCILVLLLLLVGCEDAPVEQEDVYGCTDESACNFNVDATDDDGSCLSFIDGEIKGLVLQTQDYENFGFINLYREFECENPYNQLYFNPTESLNFYILYLDGYGNEISIQSPHTSPIVFNSIEIDVQNENMLVAEYCEGQENWNPLSGLPHPCAGADFIDWGSGPYGYTDFKLTANEIGNTTFIVKLIGEGVEYISLPITVNIANE